MAEPLHQFPASPEQTFLRDICISYEKVDENICKIFQYLSGIFALIRQLLQLTTQWQNNKLRGKPNKRFCFKGFNDSFCNLRDTCSSVTYSVFNSCIIVDDLR